MAGSLLRVRLQNLAELEHLPGRLEGARERFLQRGAEALADEVRKRAPRHVAATVRGQALPPELIEVGTFGSRDAKVLDQGGTIVPHGHPFLKFENETGVHFVRRTVIPRNRPGGRFFERALRNRRSVLEAVFDETFGNLNRGA
jgi:hypothetical protein